MLMAPQEERATFEGEEQTYSEDDFEFRISAAGGLLNDAAAVEMCAADEVFFQGQILPLRLSVNSRGGPSRNRSRSESLDQSPSSVLSSGFTSRSNSSSSSSSSSSCCISRSHSSNSSRASFSNNFYAYPSPTPRDRAAALKKASAGRRSASSSPPGWGIFRIGVVKAPEMELCDIMSRRSNSGGGARRNAEGEKAKMVQRKAAAAPPRYAGGLGFSCKCSPDALEPIAVTKLAATKREEAAVRPKGGQTARRSRRRMLDWLEELSIAKSSLC